MKTLETKPWRAKPLSTFRLETPANHPIGSDHAHGKLGWKTGRKTAFWGRQVSI